ncbi:hypothetical protein J2S13_001877 [Oikeobacillus pervagus]|uniref:DUF8052 domain-containing protein n=1 Tax=Oikeobacillus pervagus TaxID=1325931 RepID=A0AAJ1WJ96_9BACI|nr:hypothetical protein [Oikeobacillus pervagus]MDQ0215460.1 hypothetical protein [Oikeobacillus pervagus]
MTTQTPTFIKKLQDTYAPFFNIEENVPLGDTSIDFIAHHLRKDEKYMLSKSIKIWGVENQQIVFVISPKIELSTTWVHQYLHNIIQQADHYIPSHDEHMSTVLIGLIITDQPTDQTLLKEVKKTRKVKFLHYGIHGWIEIYLGLVHVQNQTITIHRKGKPFVSAIGKILKGEREQQ